MARSCNIYTVPKRAAARPWRARFAAAKRLTRGRAGGPPTRYARGTASDRPDPPPNSRPPTETTTEEEPIRVPAGPPPEVVFSTPTEDETDVLQSATVRIQFSRDIDTATLKGHIRVGYLQSQTVERGEPVTPAADFTFQYSGPNRTLELRFAKPLERFRTVKVDLLDGIMGTDGQPLKPWTLTFAVGGS